MGSSSLMGDSVRTRIAYTRPPHRSNENTKSHLSQDHSVSAMLLRRHHCSSKIVQCLIKSYNSSQSRQRYCFLRESKTRTTDVQYRSGPLNHRFSLVHHPYHTMANFLTEPRPTRSRTNSGKKSQPKPPNLRLPHAIPPHSKQRKHPASSINKLTHSTTIVSNRLYAATSVQTSSSISHHRAHRDHCRHNQNSLPKAPGQASALDSLPPPGAL